MKPTLTLALRAFASCAVASLASAQFSFQAPASHPAGATPDGSAVGDFNGDGRADIAVTSDAPDKVSILSNNGNGTFTTVQQLLTGAGTAPHSLAAGDFDGDGDLDLAVTLKNVGQVRILVNTGGVFSLGPTIAVGSEPRTIVAGDVDNNGSPDLAVSNRSSNSVSVLRNTGGLTFSVQTLAAGEDPREIDMGDVTGNGFRDVVVASHDTREILVLANTGGTFAALPAISISPVRPEGIAVAQLNGGGPMDIAAATGNNGVEYATVVLSSGGGAFGAPVHHPSNGNDGSSMIAADLDGDGDNDLAIANRGSGTVSLLANNGAGGFGAPQLAGIGADPGHLAAADLDGNGSPDLIASNETPGTVTWLLNQLGGGCATVPYCTGKLTSIATVPAISSTGTPSASAGSFTVHMSGGVRGQLATLFFGANGPASAPFQDGTLCVQPPVVRFPVQAIDAGGNVSFVVPVGPAMVGTTQWYQFWFRDPGVASGTGLSNALAVTFCN
jgi:hypothetical protein